MIHDVLGSGYKPKHLMEGYVGKHRLDASRHLGSGAVAHTIAVRQETGSDMITVSPKHRSVEDVTTESGEKFYGLELYSTPLKLIAPKAAKAIEEHTANRLASLSDEEKSAAEKFRTDA